MIIYENKQEIIQHFKSIICDKCQKEFFSPQDNIEIQEFLYIRETGGYGSIFGDTTKIEGDFCQRCVKELIGKFLYIDGVKDSE